MRHRAEDETLQAQYAEMQDALKLKVFGLRPNLLLRLSPCKVSSNRARKIAKSELNRI